MSVTSSISIEQLAAWIGRNRLAQSLSKIPRFHVHAQDVCDDSSVFVQHETIP